MTMRARPTRREENREDRTAAFVEQASAEDTQPLHCLIPESLHLQLRVMAAQDRTTMTALVIDAISEFVDRRR